MSAPTNRYRRRSIASLVNGDVFHIPIESGTVHSCITSPPYWALRIYKGGASDQLGQEQNVDCKSHTCGVCYVCRTVAYSREIKRVLRSDGVYFLNVGDSYSGSGGLNYAAYNANVGVFRNSSRDMPDGLKPMDLVGVPWRVALALQEDGWTLRTALPWIKYNAKPEPRFGWRWTKHLIYKRDEEREEKIAAEVAEKGLLRQLAGKNNKPRDESLTVECPGCKECDPNGGLVLRAHSWRPVMAHEYIFMFVKSDRYFCDDFVIRVPTDAGGERGYRTSDLWRESALEAIDDLYDCATGGGLMYGDDDVPLALVANTANDGSNQSVHFAKFPERLVEPLLKASTSDGGVCSRCGSQYTRVVGRGGERVVRRSATDNNPYYRPRNTQIEYVDLGWKPSCSCDADSRPALVFDPFVGSGTTLAVARRLGRRAVGMDISPLYLREEASRKLGLTVRNRWTDGKATKPDRTDIETLPMFKENI